LKKWINLILLIAISNLLISCEELTGKSTGANIISESGNEFIGGLEGIHAGNDKFILRGTTDYGGNSGHSFRLRFKLPEGEQLNFFFFMSRNFSGGAIYTFTRTSGVVNLNISLNGKSHTHELKTYNSTEVIDIELDVHNDHTDAHLLAWKYSGPYEDAEECTFDGSCLYNSEDFSLDVWLGVGRASGSYWGFQGSKSLILILEGPRPALSRA